MYCISEKFTHPQQVPPSFNPFITITIYGQRYRSTYARTHIYIYTYVYTYTVIFLSWWCVVIVLSRYANLHEYTSRNIGISPIGLFSNTFPNIPRAPQLSFVTAKRKSHVCVYVCIHIFPPFLFYVITSVLYAISPVSLMYTERYREEEGYRYH